MSNGHGKLHVEDGLLIEAAKRTRNDAEKAKSEVHRLVSALVTDAIQAHTDNQGDITKEVAELNKLIDKATVKIAGVFVK